MFEPRVDKLNRRFRFSPPQPKGKRTVIDDDDKRMWKAIHTHGPLPTHYLASFISKVNFNTHQKRLTKQRNGTEKDGPYLVRCPIDCPDPLSTTNVYKLHPNAEKLLEADPEFYRIERKGWNIHQLLGSCVTASLELALIVFGITFGGRDQIQSENPKPLKFSLSGNRFLVPDELFRLDYGGVFRFFVCEWDRNSEPWKRTKSEGVDFVTKLNDYISVMRNGEFQKHTMVMIVTTSKARAQSIKETISELAPELAHRFIINVLDYFANPWRMPPVLTEVLEWQQADGKTFNISVSPKKAIPV